MIVVIITVSILILLIFLSMMGRSSNPGVKKFRGWSYAHRGLHRENIPENSMAAFQLALDGGYGIELDVHLLKDGNVAVIHDASLMRTAQADVNIEDLTAEELSQYRLENTDEKIPLFEDVLQLFRGKAPIIVELKVANNHAALCEAVARILDRYDGDFCVESFDPRCLLWLRRNRPAYVRGQLSENFIRTRNLKLPFILRCVMTWNLVNFLTFPDFIAYKFADRNNLSVKLCRKLWRMQGVAWTVRRLEDHEQAVAEGWLPIFENYEP